MTAYWVRFFDVRGRIAFAETITRNNDTEAISKARAMYAGDTMHGYDIWEGKRLITYVREEAG
jgi:hypothetical protein